MKSTRKLAAATVAGLAILGLSLGTATAASADPSGPADINGVGSDTTQDFMNGIAAQSGGAIASWDATGSSTITIGGITFTRPNGSGQGVQVLSLAKDTSSNHLWNGVSVLGKVDFARSSSGPVAGTDLVYIPFGVDAVTYATGPITDVPLDIPRVDNPLIVGDLSLQAIYSANIPTGGNPLPSFTLDGNSYTVGIQGSGADIVPFIPQAGSGTRTFWQAQVGGTFGTAVRDFYNDGVSNVQVQEHNGLVTGEVVNAMMPFSIAQFIAQANSALPANDGEIAGVPVEDRRNGAVLRAVDGEPAIDAGAINPGFPITRSVYNVIDAGDLGQDDTVQQELLNDAFVGSGSAVCTDTFGSPAKTLVNLFGFGTHPSCGSVSLTGAYTNLN